MKLQDGFETVIALIKKSLSSNGEGEEEEDLIPLAQDMKLKLYGLYKQATCGSADDTQRPSSMWDVTGRAKYNAWTIYRELTKEEAMLQYLELCAEVMEPVSLRKECKGILKDVKDGEISGPSSKKYMSGDGTSSQVCGTESDDDTKESSDPPLEVGDNEAAAGVDHYRTERSWFWERYTGIRPVMPRGQLDISFSDLGFAAQQCCWALLPSSSMSSSIAGYIEMQDRILRLMSSTRRDHSANKDECEDIQIGVVGSSVRSLFDLYLRTLSIAPETHGEVIVVPPINVPGMMSVIEYHGLKVVGVDLPDSAEQGAQEVQTHIAIDMNGIRAAITDRTIAILVVHPFGLISATDEDMHQLMQLAKERDIQLWEDCAQVFDGVNNGVLYRDQQYADVSFFSFGTIKKDTALGGAVALLRCSSRCQQMNRIMLSSMYKTQSSAHFLLKVLLSAIFRVIASSPLLYGFLIQLCRSILGIDFDWLARRCLRSFASDDPQRLVPQIRNRPCHALLMLLERRLKQKNQVHSNRDYNNQTDRFGVLIRSNHCRMLSSRKVSPSSNRLFALSVRDPNQTSRFLSHCGIDAPRALSQLICIDKACTRTKRLMESIIYLPLTNRYHSNSDTEQLKRILIHALSHHILHTPRSDDNQFQYSFWIFVGCLALLIFPFSIWSSAATLLLPCMAATFIVGWLLRYLMADLYLSTSTAFCQYVELLRYPLQDGEKSMLPPQASLSDVKGLEIPSRDRTGGNDTILLTGATGFVGMMVLRDLLLHRKKLGLSFVVVLCRASKRGDSVESRVFQLLQRPIFSFMEDAEKKTSVKVIEGDVKLEMAGLSSADQDRLNSQWNVIKVIHLAASVTFTQSLEEAASSIITSALNMQRLTKQLPNKSAKFVHISTAFVHGDMSGSQSTPLPEELFPLHPYTAQDLFRSMLGTQYVAKRAMRRFGFSNTYTFTKSICEHLLLECDEGETIIVRPSIVGPSIQEPFEGWAGYKPTTVVAIIAVYLKSQWNLHPFGNNPLPVIPVDIVSRFILVQAFAPQCQAIPFEGQSTRGSSDGEDSFEEVNDTRSLSPFSMVGTDTSSLCAQRIHNAVWKTSDSQKGFNLYQMAVASVQLGNIFGYLQLSVGYFGLLICTKILPLLRLNHAKFQKLHSVVVKGPISLIVSMAQYFLGLETDLVKRLRRAQLFSDLPCFFYPFMSKEFVFESELSPPDPMDGIRYMFSCIVAAHRYLESREPQRVADCSGSCRNYVIAGRQLKRKSFDAWWAWTQPKGNTVVRFVGVFMITLLRLVASEVTVDLESFAALLRAKSRIGADCRIVLCPTHRSFLDFMLISFLAFAVPELDFDVPHIAAAEEFSNLFLLGTLAQYCRAFFLKRGLGISSKLEDTVARIKRKREPCFELFIEGTRSRDRRFVEPHTGLLNCIVKDAPENCIVVPITINYERVPEQTAMSHELNSGTRQNLSVTALFGWMKRVICGQIDLGRIHIIASNPLHMETSQGVQVKALAQQIQYEQMRNTIVSSYHVRAAAVALDLDEQVIEKAINSLGGTRWSECNSLNPLPQPKTVTELWTVLLQVGHLIAPELPRDFQHWSSWFDPSGNWKRECSHPEDDDVRELMDAVVNRIVTAEKLIAESYGTLRSLGFNQPKVSHILQNIDAKKVGSVPVMLLLGAASIHLGLDDEKSGSLRGIEARSLLPVKYISKSRLKGGPDQILGRWGWSDTSFVVDAESTAAVVSMTGSRYSFCQRRLSKLVPFIEKETNIKIDLCNENYPQQSCMSVSITAVQNGMLEILKRSATHVSVSDEERCFHGCCQSQSDIVMLRNQTTDNVRMPDAVVWPETLNEVQQLIVAARDNGFCLIPFGGGTNVTKATRCPTKEVEPRPIISIDMKLLNKVLWVNEEDGLAHVEAGITGKRLEEQLRKRGYTAGHEPDSYEFSTLGGWIATNASGMKRGRYGNIEDVVKNVHLVSSTGEVGVHDGANGRVSHGPDIIPLVFGSEGCLGIVTSAVIRIWTLPSCVRFESIVLRDFTTGLHFMRDIPLSSVQPASVRLLDNNHFRLGQVLHGDTSAVETVALLMVKLKRWIRSGWDRRSAVCATILMEGTPREVSFQHQTLRELSDRHGGFMMGQSMGKAGYELTFCIAYLRDFALSFHFLGDSFETFVPWSKVDDVVESTKKLVVEEHTKRRLPGNLFVASRVTQAYHEGACVYFYLCMNIQDVENPSAVFDEIETAATKRILSKGGSLSHHHGIGKVRSALLSDVKSSLEQRTTLKLKQALDPSNVFVAGNGPFALN